MSAFEPDALFLFLKLRLLTSKPELSTCAAGVGCLSLMVGLDSPVRKGMVVVRLAGLLLGELDARMPGYMTGSTVTLMRASPVSMRKDLDGEARGLGATEEGATLRRVKVCAARGEDARCNGSGEDEPDREDMRRAYRRVYRFVSSLLSGRSCFVVS